jgi:hypothetical protein
MGELDPFGRKGIDVRRGNRAPGDTASIERQVVPAKIVRNDQDNIRRTVPFPGISSALAPTDFLMRAHRHSQFHQELDPSKRQFKPVFEPHSSKYNHDDKKAYQPFLHGRPPRSILMVFPVILLETGVTENSLWKT